MRGGEFVSRLQLKGVGPVPHRYITGCAALVVADARQRQPPLLPRPLQVVERPQVLVRSFRYGPWKRAVRCRPLACSRRASAAVVCRQRVGARPSEGAS